MDLGKKIRKGVDAPPIEAPVITPVPERAPQPERETVPVKRDA